MNIGKREQIVGVSIGTLLTIFLIHLFIFKPKSDEYARVESEYKQAVETLRTAERPPSPGYLSQFNAKTQQYNDQITSVVGQLNLDKPDYYNSPAGGNIEKRIAEVVGLLNQLVTLRARVQAPRLVFLDDRRAAQHDLSPQAGWNIPPQLPNVGAQGALWDVVVKINEQHRLMNNIQDPNGYMEQRARYNALIRTIGVIPAEVSDWVVNMPRLGYVFFNDVRWAQQFGAAAVPNPLSTNQFGPLVPALKKLWITELIWQKRDPNSPITKDRLREIFEVNIPTGSTLLQTSKQLKALIEIVSLAQKNGIMEISRVSLMKTVPVDKSFQRLPGVVPKSAAAASPTPAAATGDAMMFGDPTLTGGGMGVATPTPAIQAIGTGTGVELWFRGDNKQIVEFLFDITHAPRTYALDDLYIRAIPNQPLETSATVEIVTALDNIKK